MDRKRLLIGTAEEVKSDEQIEAQIRSNEKKEIG
jgi:hypothetical protein